MLSSSPAAASAGRALAAFRARPLLAGAVVLFFVLVSVYAFSVDIPASRGAAITGDEPFYLLTTQSLLQDGDLDLRQQYERRSYREFFDHPDGLWRQSVPTKDGRLLSPHNPGLSVLLMPGFAAAGLLGAQAQLLVMTALTFALTYVLVARLTGLPLLSWLACLAVALTSTAFIYSTEVYPEVTAALALVASLLLVAGKESPGPWRALALAAILSALAWLGVKYVPLGFLVAGYFLWRAGNSGRAALLAGAVPAAMIYVWFHLATFGELTPYSVNTVYAGSSTIDVVNAHVDFDERIYRLWGLFIDRRFGIARWAPVLLLVVPGLLKLARGGGVQRLALALIAAQVGIATFVAITMMGWWFPGRTLMAVLPLMSLPLAAVLQQASKGLRGTAAVLGLYSLAVTGALAYAGHAREIFIAVDPFDLQAALFRVPARLFPQYTSWGSETRLLTAAWLTAGAAALALAAGGRATQRLASTLRALGRRTSSDRKPQEALPDQPWG